MIPIATEHARARMYVFRMAQAPSRCHMMVLEGSIAQATLVSQQSGNGCVHDAAQSANAHADCHSISLVSASSRSECLRDDGDQASAIVSEHGRDHDGCESWPKLAE